MWFARALSHSSDTINLRDALGNLADHVKYGDGEPTNDVEPEDDVNDGTFRSPRWPDGADGSLTIGQDARMYAGLVDAGETTAHELPPGRMAWLHLARGRVRLNGAELAPGDGAAIREERALSIEGVEDAELVLWELPEAD